MTRASELVGSVLIIRGKRGGQHGLELAGLGCVDILRTSVRRGDDSERE
jgi:hypothetical protein